MDEEIQLGAQTRREIASQPDLWEQAKERADASGLPRRGESVLVLGSGTSYYVGAAYAWLREQEGHGLTDALIASELPPHVRSYDRVLAISRSGTTADLIQALDRLAGTVPVTVILGERGTPIEAQATHIVDFSFADETSVVQTRFPTTQLAMLLTTLGHGDRVAALAARCRLLFQQQPSEARPEQFVVLAEGWAAFLAQEGALKVRESAGMWAEAYASGEYLHGPISVAGDRTLVWAMTPLTAVQRAAVRETGARLHETDDDPLLQLVEIQRHAVQWASQKGRDADRPAHLSRSVLRP